jgi:hypothetical protein
LGGNAKQAEFVFALGENEFELFGTRVTAIACLNEDCRKVTLTVALHKAVRPTHGYDHLTEEELNWWRLLPESSAKPLPEYIPTALRVDYVEACRIRDLSPKASATLARRCLQGMIRDFGSVNEKTLFLQINKLEELVKEDKAPRGVSADSIEAIHAVRKIGNIGAHMESDINLIVDIDPDEAQILIELIESLFEEWYVSRHQREQRFKKIVDLDKQKSDARKSK